MNGHATIAGFYDLVKQLYPDFAFKPEDTHMLIEHLINSSPSIPRTRPRQRRDGASTMSLPRVSSLKMGRSNCWRNH
jgi:hypothetical protein